MLKKSNKKVYKSYSLKLFMVNYTYGARHSLGGNIPIGGASSGSPSKSSGLRGGNSCKDYMNSIYCVTHDFDGKNYFINEKGDWEKGRLYVRKERNGNGKNLIVSVSGNVFSKDNWEGKEGCFKLEDFILTQLKNNSRFGGGFIYDPSLRDFYEVDGDINDSSKAYQDILTNDLVYKQIKDTKNGRDLFIDSMGYVNGDLLRKVFEINPNIDNRSARIAKRIREKNKKLFNLRNYFFNGNHSS